MDIAVTKAEAVRVSVNTILENFLTSLQYII